MKPKPALASCFLILLLSIPATAKERAPSWVTDWKSAFPDSQYIAQRGTGKSAELARTDALGAVARYLRSEVRASLSTSLMTDGGTERAETRQDVLVTAQADLYGAEFTEPYLHKKTWYCVAYIDRAKTWAQALPDVRAKEAAFRMDVMGGADLTTETQKKIGALFSEMKADADKKELKQSQEEAALYREQIAWLEAEIAQYREAQSAKKDEVRKATELAIELEAFLQ